MRMFAKIILILIFCNSPVFAESDANNLGKCDVPALRKMCNESPFSSVSNFSIIYYNNFMLCKNNSTTYTLKSGEALTSDKLNLFCKGVYGH